MFWLIAFSFWLCFLLRIRSWYLRKTYLIISILEDAVDECDVMADIVSPPWMPPVLHVDSIQACCNIQMCNACSLSCRWFAYGLNLVRFVSCENCRLLNPCVEPTFTSSASISFSFVSLDRRLQDNILFLIGTGQLNWFVLVGAFITLLVWSTFNWQLTDC